MRRLTITLCALLMAVCASALNENPSNETNSVNSTKGNNDDKLADILRRVVSDVECPTLIMPSSKTVNVRQSPSTKARKVGTVDRNNAYAVIAEQNGWYKIRYVEWEEIKTGWVSGTVVRVVDNAPITAEMQNATFGYVGDQDEDVDFDQTYINRVYIRPDDVCLGWVGNSFEGCMYLGRYTDNVCCFKYCVALAMYELFDDTGFGATDVSEMSPLVKDGNKKTGLWTDISSGWGKIVYGSDFAIKLNGKMVEGNSLDLSKLDDRTLIVIFGELIKNGTTCPPLYINSTLLSDRYVK